MKYCLAIFFIFSCSTSYAKQILNKDYWQQFTHTGMSYKCTLAHTKSTMVGILKNAGWATNRFVPPIEWSSQSAVIIAPEKYYNSKYMRFYGLKIENNTLYLDYGWQGFKSGRTKENMTSSGATFPSDYETIVVPINDSLLNTMKFFCRNLGIVD